MKALDLFCGAGGMSMGLHMAGFEVTGVDINPQPHYPFRFVQADALTYNLRGYDLIHASPPCQSWCAYTRRKNHVAPKPQLIRPIRERLLASEAHYIIENVEGARAELIDPIVLCGSMFGLDVRRHRYFETSFGVVQPRCLHHLQTPRFPPATNRTNLRSTVEVGVWRIQIDVQRRAMGIDWMSLEELSQAIPPAYGEHLARAFINGRK